MAGIVYMKSNSSVSLTSPEYVNIDIPSGCKTLYIQTGSATTDRIKYGLTTDPTATSYSPVINVSGTTMMIAKQSTISETITTDTVYHTTTRESTSSSSFSVTSYLTTSFSRTSGKVIIVSSRNSTSTCTFRAFYYEMTNTYIYDRLTTNSTKASPYEAIRYSRSKYEYTYHGIDGSLSTLRTYSTIKSATNPDPRYVLVYNDISNKYAEYTTICTTSLTRSPSEMSMNSMIVNTGTDYYRTYYIYLYSYKVGQVSQYSDMTSKKGNISRAYLSSATLRDFMLPKSISSTFQQYFEDFMAQTNEVTTGVLGNVTYATRKSTYTSRTEYLTSLSTRTTNNAA